MKRLFYGFIIVYMFMNLTSCTQDNTVAIDNTKPSISDSINTEPTSSASDLPEGNHNQEPDIHRLVGEDKIVRLIIKPDTFLLKEDVITYSILNNSGKDIWVLLIPTLERENNSEWEIVPAIGVGFCGMADLIDSQYNGELPLAWYADTLTAGRYRLSFSMVNENEPDVILSDIFVLSDLEISLNVKKDSLNSKGTTLVLINNLDYEYTFGDQYLIEQKSEDGWRSVETIIQNYSFNDIGHTLKEYQSLETDVDWEWLYGDLVAGEYRIMMDLMYIRSPGDVDTYSLAAEFTID